MFRGAQSQGHFTKIAKAMAKTMAKAGVKDWRMEIETDKITIVASEVYTGASPDGQTSADLRKLL
jgi:hypothetical protein